MLSIGEFARLGQVSVRMLRHYDGIGLLSPVRVDPATGYRWYDADQLSRLNRVLALKDLGFTLDQVGSMVDDEVTPEELRGMLRLRHSELVTQIGEDRERLARVERRLRTIEREGTMSEQEYTVKALPALRVAARTSTVDSVERLGDVVGPNFEALTGLVGPPAGPAVAYYDFHDDGTVTASSALPYDGEPGDGFEVVDLPAVDRAATVLHHGSMDTIADTWQELVRHVEQAGDRMSGRAREVYLAMPSEDQSTWVTELQEPLA